MTDASAESQWAEDRTTFQRVYDVLVGTREFLSANGFADRAACSEAGARSALEQLAEMGIAERRDGRPVTYRRNEAYVEWKRVQALADEHSSTALQERIDQLIEEDEAFQAEYGVPDPDAVTTADLPVDDHETLHDRWEDLTEWRTVRRDIRLLRRAVERAEARVDDGVQV